MIIHTHKRTAEYLRRKVSITEAHLAEGKCLDAASCAVKLGIAADLEFIDPGVDHKVRVDSANIAFTLKGFRYRGPTPKKPAKALVSFDKELKARQRAMKRGEKFVSAVKPFVFSYEAEKVRAVNKIGPRDRARLDQINKARKEREEREGRSDGSAYQLRKRIEGYQAV